MKKVSLLLLLLSLSLACNLPAAATSPTPPPAQKPTLAITLQPGYAVNGSILLEEGACCVGATEGEQVEINARFVAHSTQGEVSEMRTASVTSCNAPDLETQLHQAAWEPYSQSKTYTTTAFLNWVGFYIGVQYRDSQGNLSPVYCDDISVEGMPAEPSAQP